MSNIAIIFGAGAKTGVHAANKFISNGYKVVTVSRSQSIDLSSVKSEDNSSHYHFQGDLKDLTVVGKVFSKTRELYGEPRVVIYNAAASRLARGDAVFDIDIDLFLEQQNINVTSVLLSVREALKSFKAIDSTKPKSFIYTGNLQNVRAYPYAYSGGVGKSGTFSTLQVAEEVFGKAYGYRFYYADQRTPEGGPILPDGIAASEFFFDLAENENKDIPVEATFVDGKGYTRFNEIIQ